ncbi:MAG: sodium:calcium antiporter [Nevskiaceae bacterium]|nr:MAG: sodium:calcium antiporter [Nevskiaceae bacterium]TAM26690.1 MAG: sodium:calcium antiporter [Nevskiaceae bacterium]
MIYLLVFLLSGAVVVVAGTALARHADAIAEATRIGRLWVGSVLLAGATSLPELTTDLAAVRLGAPDLAVGDLFGSSLANMLILALLDLMPPRGQVLRNAGAGHVLAASLAISLNALAAVLVLVGLESSFLWIGPGSLLLFCAYLAGTRATYLQAVNGHGVVAEETAAPRSRLRPALYGFAAAALWVLLAAPAFAWSAKGIAEISGLGNTFVGTWLVGLATSLPELAASLAAVRLGALDLAVGNLFGSNAFNMAIFLPLDLAQPGNLFAAIDRGHALTGLFAVLLTSLGLAAIVYRVKGRYQMLEPGSVLMVLAYFGALWTLYRHTAGG